MKIAIIIVLAVLCIVQLIHILHMKKQEREWLTILKSIREGHQNKIFINKNNEMADIGYELNEIIKDNKAQIIKLKKADEANKQILTSLSHDVRTPLASLMGYLEALNKGDLDKDAQREYLSVAYRKSGDLKAYVDMLFEWFKINSEEQQYNFVKEDINELTRQIIIEWLPILNEKKIQIQVEASEDELIVSLDVMAYRRIINNLIQNAVRHGQCNTIFVKVISQATSVMVSVTNNGSIIPPEQLPHLFERLYRGDKARSDRGSGLGLAITKELTHALGGNIDVISAQNTGTVFTIELPYQK